MGETVTVLDASYGGLSADGLAGLLAGAEGTGPVDLVLEGNPIGDDGAGLLGAWAGLARVRVLNLADTGIGPAGLKALAGSPYRPRPAALYLDENPLGDEGVRLLADSALLSQVRRLGLGGTGLDHPSVRALVESPHGAAVLTLRLAQTELSPESWALLRGRFPEVVRG